MFILTELEQVPRNRAHLFQGFLEILHLREKTAREKRQDVAIPAYPDWETALIALAATMQRATQENTDDGAQTSLPRTQCPVELNQTLLDFSIDASVLQIRGEDIRFSHQLLQEYLASRLLLDASRTQDQPASAFWPQTHWWERTGWEVVAEIAAESCSDDAEAQIRLIEWLAQANPEVACAVWKHVGQIDLPQTLFTAITDQWFLRMTSIEQEPEAKSRAAIGRALGSFSLDKRKGIGLRTDGLPDIDWVKIPSSAFIYQDAEHPPLPVFYIARYPVTHAQFQVFIDAGGYQEDRWWQGLHQRIEAPMTPSWTEPNAPRETVSWFEAVAFCRWLSAQLGYGVSLPTEQQWERAARGTKGMEYPWGNTFQQNFANGNAEIGRTSAVSLYPQGASPDGVLDMAGNVWEWCLNEYSEPDHCQLSGDESRVLRGGSWYYNPAYLRASHRGNSHPDYRYNFIGLRVVCLSPIE